LLQFCQDGSSLYQQTGAKMIVLGRRRGGFRIALLPVARALLILALLIPAANVLGQELGGLAPASDTQDFGSYIPERYIFDRYIKVQLPAGWRERRAWELGDDRSLPLYNGNLEAVSLVWGFDHPLYPKDYIRGLGSGERLKQRLEMDLSQWPAEAARYYAMVTAGFGMRSSSHTVTVGPSFKPAQIKYLGEMKFGSARVELIEYVSEGKVDEAFAHAYKLRPELVGSKVQILFGQAKFGQNNGYTVTACRFVMGDADTEWLRPLLEAIVVVPTSQRQQAENAERGRDIVSHAAAVAADHRESQALTQLGTALALNPQDDNALMVEGEILQRQGKIAEAETMLRRAIASNSDNDRAHFDLATALRKLKKSDEAMAELQIVERLSPLYPGIQEMFSKMKAARTVAFSQPE
jgi:tetratricopeptide (TPR) repeat protein